MVANINSLLTYNECIQIYVKGHNLLFWKKKRKKDFLFLKFSEKREQVEKRKKYQA